MVGQLVIEATWDAEAGVWVAVSEAIGLVTEAETIEALRAKLPGMIQDLLEDEDDGEEVQVPFELIAHEYSRVTVRRHA
jgi:predicted RNase H-like HicB family nuclease